jgi:nucleoside-diphosphate-sugar epimerase
MSASSLLLGGSGFIGTALARCLTSHGAICRIADIRPSPFLPGEWVRTDVRDRAAVASACAGTETVFLLAAEHGLEPRPDQQFREVNVDGARAVVAGALMAGVRSIVFTSTVAVYGLRRGVSDEDTLLRPSGAYGRTKVEAEGILRAWQADDPSRSLTIVRPTLVFGAGVRGHMRSLLHRLAHPDLVMIGDGRNRKSLACVENLAAFLAHVAAVGPGVRIYNYADGPDLSMGELSALLRVSVGIGSPRGRRSRASALLRAAAGLAPDGVTPTSLAQVWRFCSDSRFVSRRIASAGFRPPVALNDAVRAYARSDLRWLSPSSHLLPVEHVPAA